MVDISDFRAKWDFYKPRAHRISPYFAEFGEGARLTQDVVAARIPKSVSDPILATDGASIAGAAFGNWLASGTVPDNRVSQWQELTGLSISIWRDPLSSFERALRQKTGEVWSWSALVQERVSRGPLRVRPRDREPLQQADGSSLKFTPDGYDPDARPVDIALVWPGCIAHIVLPTRASRDGEDRRVWLLADYGDRVFMLDPAKPPQGKPSPSQIDQRCWRPDRREGHVVLPRVAPGYVSIPQSAKPGTRFEVIALTLNLSSQPDEIRSLFDAIERRLLVDIRELALADYQKLVRAALEEAAALVGGHDVAQVVHAQACEIVDRATAIEQQNG
jgi:hypothetical protein